MEANLENGEKSNNLSGVIRLEAYRGFLVPDTFEGTLMTPLRYGIKGAEVVQDRFLRGALLFQAQVIRREAYQETKWMAYIFAFLWWIGMTTCFVLFTTYTPFMASFNFILFLEAVMISSAIALYCLYRRYVLVPACHEKFHRMVSELAPRFHREGWHLEYVVENASSFAKIEAYVKLSPVTNDFAGPSSAGDATSPGTDEIWVALHDAVAIGLCKSLCQATPYEDYFEGLPKGFGDVFLWGALVEDVNKAKMQFRSEKYCATIGQVFLLFLFIGWVPGSLLAKFSDDGWDQVIFLALFYLFFFIGYQLLQTFVDAWYAPSFHWACQRAITDLAPHFEREGGFFLEFVREGQEIPLYRRWLPNAGRCFVRLVPTSSAYQPIPAHV